MKTAIVHEWLTGIGGSEKAAAAIYEIYPSPIFTLVHNPVPFHGTAFEHATIHTSFIQKLPWAATRYRIYLPLFPLAVEQFDLAGYEVVISSSHAVAKGVLTDADQLHVCYCYTPIRYCWDLYHEYLREANLVRGLKGMAAKAVIHYLRLWDLAASARVDSYAAISRHVAARIRKIYGREAAVIYPPVDVDRFDLCREKEDFYVTASRMVPYKRMDLIVEAFSHMPDKKLFVIGDGPGFAGVKAMAKKNIEILGHQSDEVLKQYLQRARAFIFAAHEDFGILPVEAQCCGTPVIAYGRGGVRETVIDGRTGILFEEQTVSSLAKAVADSETKCFDAQEIRHNAERFSKDRFRAEFQFWVTNAVSRFRNGDSDKQRERRHEEFVFSGMPEIH